MIVITDKALRAAGIDYATAIGLLAPPEGELIVHIKTLSSADVPPVAPPGDIDAIDNPADASATLDSQPFSSPAIAPPATDQRSVAAPVYTADEPDGGHIVRRTHLGKQALSEAKPTNQPTNGAAPVEQLHEVSPPPAGHDGLGRLFAGAVPANLLGVPRLLPERGFTAGDVQRVAAALHCTADVEPTGRTMLTGAFGCRVFDTLAEAVVALNARSFNP